jgi:HPt (histidine-containing phosphotransfer) domain-containing protein
MYYITNQDNQIIAIDPSLLALLEVKNIDELYRNIALGDIKFSLSAENEKITIKTAQNEETYGAEHHRLSGILGNMILVQVQVSLQKSIPVEDDTLPIEDFLAIETTEEDEILILDDIQEEVNDAEAEKNEIENDNEIFDLILPDGPEETIDNISLTETKPAETIDNSQTPIIIDVEKICQNIGISIEDYKTFFNEYVDTALSLEKDLQSTQEEKRSHAVNTLSRLSNVLNLPVISEIVTQIENAGTEQQMARIESFYATLSRLTITQEGAQTKKPLFVPETELATIGSESFGTIDLNEVQPIHFDFQLGQVANELGLPKELIEEFIHDFIAQAHTETKKMLEAYDKGDLDSIQKIGHLLKGASSNLRIKALSDALYEIQLCSDSSKLENLIKRYWGHFLSLEIQIDLRTK